MVLVRAQRALRDVTQSGLELVASQVRVTGESPECHRSKLSNSEQIRSAQNWRLSIPRDSSLRYEAPAPNGFQIGVQTSPHAPFEVRRVRSTRPTRARGRRRLEYTRHAPPRARTVAHAPHAPTDGSRALARAPTRPHALPRGFTRQASGGQSQPAPARACTRQESGGNAQARSGTRHTRPARPSLTRKPIRAKALSEFSRHSGFIREVGFQRFSFHFGEVRRRSDLRALIMLSDADYAPGKPRMRNEMNRKMIGQIRQCIGHEHDETSAHGLWTKLEEMYREKTSQNKVLLRRLVLKLQRGTTVAEQTSEFQRATGRGQKKRPEKRTVRFRMADGRSMKVTGEKLQEKEDWKAIPTEGECPDRRELLSDIGPVVLARWMDEEAIVAQRHAKQAQEYLMDVLQGSIVEQERKEMLWDTCGSLARHEKVQPLQDVHEKAQRRETESMHNDRRDVAETSLFRSRSVAVISPVVHTREERWSQDDLQSDVLCRAPRGGAERAERVEDGRRSFPPPWSTMDAGHTAECCVQRGWERGECYGASESTESTERSDTEWARIGSYVSANNWNQALGWVRLQEDGIDGIARGLDQFPKTTRFKGNIKKRLVMNHDPFIHEAQTPSLIQRSQRGLGIVICNLKNL
ncbi:hypothetical protein Acr_16g0001230 [Actinidia rufa]|uniref:Uncharacterized protein n=1 Tax=Actinidia rufa TaxID=165716 RepID=A0A7J0FXT3_9ERIC|nr:hypothetical protein Acr_16g0001230 [Actinidia rufa]